MSLCDLPVGHPNPFFSLIHLRRNCETPPRMSQLRTRTVNRAEEVVDVEGAALPCVV